MQPQQLQMQQQMQQQQQQRMPMQQMAGQAGRMQLPAMNDWGNRYGQITVLSVREVYLL